MNAPQRQGDPQPPLPASIMAFYASGALGPATILSAVSTQLLLYWTDIAGLAPALAGALLFAAKAIDALTDLAVGVASDRWNTRWGRRRPWILAGAILLAVSCATMFHVDQLATQNLVVVSIATALLFFVGLSMAQVPHLAMAAELTRGYEERTTLSAYVYGSNVAAGILGVALPPALVAAFGGGAAGFHGMSLTIAPIPLLAGIVCVWGTGRAPVRQVARRKGPENAVKWLPSLVSNRPLMILAAAKICTYFGASSVFTGMAYYALYVARLGASGMIVFGSAVALGNVTGLAIMIRVFHGVDKHRLYGFSLLGLAVVTLLFGIAGPHRSIVAFGAHVFVFDVLAAAVAVPGQSMIPDVIEWDQLRSGPGREGAISSLISAIQKATPAFSALSISALLSWGGYTSGLASEAPSAGATQAIILATAILPGIVFGVGAIPLLFFYKLNAHALTMARAASEDL